MTCDVLASGSGTPECTRDGFATGTVVIVLFYVFFGGHWCRRDRISIVKGVAWGVMYFLVLLFLTLM